MKKFNSCTLTTYLSQAQRILNDMTLTSGISILRGNRYLKIITKHDIIKIKREREGDIDGEIDR